MTLEELRTRLSSLDRQLLTLIAERQELSRNVAEAKQAEGRGIRDFQREREVILQARANAQAFGISPALAENLMRMLIRSSLTAQERIRVSEAGRGSGKTALVIGGGGKMGRWFSEFLGSQGYSVIVADPKLADIHSEGREWLSDWRDAPMDTDLVVVATPIKVANQVLHDLALRKPSGVVFDIGSLKTPLRAGLTALRAAGVRVTSIHPMFGPDTELLSGRHVIFVDVGDTQAVQEAQTLFGSTMAEQVVMSLDEHDRLNRQL